MLPLGTTFELNVREEQTTIGSHQSHVWYDAICTVIDPPDIQTPSPDVILRCEVPEHANEPYRMSVRGETKLETALEHMNRGVRSAIAYRRHGLEFLITSLDFHREHFQPMRFLLNTY